MHEPCDGHENGAGLECPAWVPGAFVAPDTVPVVFLGGDGGSAIVQTAFRMPIAGLREGSIPRYYFASVPPPCSWLQFCRFLE